MMAVEVGIGDEIASDFGVGDIKAITDDWIVYALDDGEEVAIHREKNAYWVPADIGNNGLDEERTVQAELDGSDDC